ncbi:MAG: hypothetical protein ACO3JL_02520 [Myxococcota bacterium]
MADQHRRIEPRGIVGSGMLNDPERIEQLEHERARHERGWRDAPQRRFGEILRDPFVSEQRGDDARQTRREPGREGDDAEGNNTEGGDEADEARTKASLPRVPPDPRAARLHASLRKETEGK